MFAASKTASVSGGYQISRSLRFNSADSANLRRTYATSGTNNKIRTISAWVKRSTLGAVQVIMGGDDGGANQSRLLFQADDTLNLRLGGGASNDNVTTAVFRDPSAWYHIVALIDTTQATAANRAQIYVNGVQQSIPSPTSTQNQTTAFANPSSLNTIGEVGGTGSSYLGGYLTEFYFIDGQALTPSSFGETNAQTGVWQPKAYSGSYGTNGFYLNFSDNSNTTAATLGKDYSGNGNNWTPNNFTVSGSYGVSTATLGGTYGAGSSGTFADLVDNSTATGYGATVNANGQTVTLAINFTGVTNVTSLRVFAYFRSGQTAQVSVNSGAYTTYTLAGNTGYVDVTSQLLGSTTLTRIDYRMTHAIGGGEVALVYAIEVNGAIIGAANPANIDSLVDSPTSYGTDTGVGGTVRGNYATWNPLDKFTATTALSNGNLDFVLNTGAQPDETNAVATIALSSGKWYWEGVWTSAVDAAPIFGVWDTVSTTPVRNRGTSYFYGYLPNGNKYNSGTQTSYGTSWTTNDVIGVALDMDNGTLTFYKNGVSQGTAFSSLSGKTLLPIVVTTTGSTNATSTGTGNFGQRPFAYTAPSGFKALCTQNLPTPTIGATSTTLANQYFTPVLYSGDGTTGRSIAVGFQPDFTWIKTRDPADWHVLDDSVRGAGKILASNSTQAEATDTTAFNAFNSNGFVVGTSAGWHTNRTGGTYVAWNWKANGSGSTNTAGSITSTVSANTTSGFSVVTYTGTGSAATIGHGLGIAPSMLIFKSRSSGSENWNVYHKSLGTSNNILLNLTIAAFNDTAFINNTAPTSTVLSVGGSGSSGTNASGGTYVCYAFAEVAGYSKFGSYTGNGSADGPFVFTGMRPAYVMIKQTNAAAPWIVFDAVRNPSNAADNILYPNTSGAEDKGVGTNPLGVDFLSNGFKIRNADAWLNGTGSTYIYMAFASAPLKFSLAR